MVCRVLYAVGNFAQCLKRIGAARAAWNCSKESYILGVNLAILI